MHNDSKMRTTSPRILAALLVLTACAALALPLHAQQSQGGTTRYLYDDAGRLSVVIAPTGEAVIYEYDAAGNFTAIRRATANTLLLLAFTPRSGAEGDRVTIIGTGFGAGVNNVSFNGVPAQIIETTANTIATTVPVGATTGPITVNAARGTATTSRPFTVRPRLGIAPTSARVYLGESQQFTLSFSAQTPDHNVTWSVNGVVGGNANFGTISNAGLYTAPTERSRAGVYTVRATSVSAPSIFIEATVIVRDPENTQELRADVSVLRGRSEIGVAASVLVERPTGLATTIGVSGAGVLVQYGPPAGLNSIGPAVTVTKGAHIASIAPLNVQRGTTATVTITGANLAGANALSFIGDDGNPDAGITVTNVNATADGTSLTATVNVGVGVGVGGRTVVVSTAAAGSSTRHNTGQNVVGITQ